ncbi:FAD-dependent oxidoreductase [Alkalibacillus aidingensis]|uniref:FAD-dependent oxidoreductase n=1 Tax=Alkalibacillus aidingensis TaxID=2747607 RepID=UPI0016617BEE|nr:FAD-dependent oxidoreductase [Alkalibacillus aidingensis]
MELRQTDILVIGSGAAGLSSAVYAAQSNQHVLVLDKGVIGRSGSSTGAVQIAALGEWSNEDHKDSYLKDIDESGRGLSESSLMEALAEDISDRLKDLTEWGLKLDRNKDKQIAVSHTSGHSLPRSVSAKKGKTGLGILHTLRKKANASDHIETWNDVITIDLIKNGNRVVGAFVLDLKDHQPYLIQCKSVILATGGAGQLYPTTSNPVQSTSDGFSLGLSAGANLVDMEQVQFYPVSMVAPNSIAGFCISFYHYSKLYNSNGSRFMENYEPKQLEDTTRDKLAIAIATEVADGRGTENGGVWLDAADEIDQVKKEFPHEYKLCHERGIDFANNRAEIGPAAHFMMGGVQINEHGATEIPGLYVAGETAGGLHGGNRLGNNALSDCIVFGARAGISSAKEADELSSMPEVNDSMLLTAQQQIEQILTPINGEIRPYQLKEQIQTIMGQHVGVIRTNQGLKIAKEQLDEVETQMRDMTILNTEPYSREILDSIEARHMLRTAKAIVGSAIIRKESRGAHHNTDHPSLASSTYHTVANSHNGELSFSIASVQGGESK